MTPPLEVAGLHLSYAGVPALRGIDLAVAPGEFVALLGPSGCGKTTLLRAIAGFAVPDQGAIWLAGRDVARVPARARNIGLVFQGYALFPHMTAAGNVRFGLECRGVASGEADRRVADALALVGLTDLAARRPAQLSGGQQQRVALARALVIEPDLLLLDEPLGALDRQLRTGMQTELRALQRRLGVAALFVTHDQEEAMSLADRVAVMRGGEIVQVDTPERLFSQPCDAWTCAFLGAGTLLRGRLLPVAEGRWRMQVAPGVRFEAEGTTPGALFIPAGSVQVRPAPDGTGLPVSARRFLGTGVEVQVATPAGIVAALMPPDAAAPFLLGRPVLLHADPARCRLLPDATSSPGGRGSSSVTSAVLLGPVLLFYGVFLVLPYAVLLRLSFFRYSATRLWVPDFTLANYAAVMTDPFYLALIGRTVLLGIGVTAVTLLLGYPLALKTARARPRLKRVLLAITLSPLLINLVVRSYAWLVLLGDAGLVNRGLMALGVTAAPLAIGGNLVSVTIGMVHIGLPLMVISLVGVIERIDRSLPEAAESLGAGPARVLRRVLLPLSLPGIGAGCLLVFCFSISAFVTPAVLGGSRVATVSTVIYDKFTFSVNWPVGATLVMALLALTLLVVALHARAGRAG